MQLYKNYKKEIKRDQCVAIIGKRIKVRLKGKQKG